MSKLRILILEDEFFAANHLKDLITDLGYLVVGVFHSGEDFLKETDWNFDIAIVDILLSEKMLGLDVAEHLQKKQKPFIFLTANRDANTLTKAARLSPKAYLSKPFNPNDIAVTLAMVSLQKVQNIEVRGTNGTIEINPNDILFIKSEGAYIEIQTTEKRIIQRKLLKEIETELPENFKRTHRSYIVNSDYVSQRSSTELHIDGHIVPISRSYKNF